MTSCLFEDEIGLAWKFAGHNSPLFGRREEDEVEHPGHNFNVNDTIAWWLSEVRVHFRVGNYLGWLPLQYPSVQGAPAEKLTVGMPTFGHGWELMDESEVIYWNRTIWWKIFPQNGLFCLTAGNSPRGPYTGQLGFLGYYEILQALNNDTWVWQFSVGILSENRLEWCIAQFQNLHSLPWLPGATPKAWETVVDGCYLAPYITNGPWWVDN